MTLEDQVASLELATCLKELGMKQESYFKWFCTNKKYAHLAHDWSDISKTLFEEIRTDFPAFTVAELGEMLRETYYSKWETSWDSIGDNWRGSLNTGTTNDGQLIHHWVDADTEADARAKMLIYLFENNLLPHYHHYT